jgi:hypothetical protein
VLLPGSVEVGVTTRHVDHHVKSWAQFVGQPVHLLWIRRIAGDRPRVDLGRRVGEPVGVPPSDDHCVTARAEPGGYRLADPVATAGDQDNSTHSCPPRYV